MISGQEYRVQTKYVVDIEGKWSIDIGKNYILELSSNNLKFTGKLLKDSTEYTLNKLKVVAGLLAADSMG